MKRVRITRSDDESCPQPTVLRLLATGRRWSRLKSAETLVVAVLAEDWRVASASAANPAGRAVARVLAAGPAAVVSGYRVGRVDLRQSKTWCWESLRMVGNTYQLMMAHHTIANWCVAHL